MEWGVQLVQVSTGLPGGDATPYAPRAALQGWWARGGSATAAPGCVISLVSALRTPVLQKVITVLILCPPNGFHYGIMNYAVQGPNLHINLSSFFLFFRKPLKNVDLSHENLCKVLI